MLRTGLTIAAVLGCAIVLVATFRLAPRALPDAPLAAVSREIAETPVGWTPPEEDALAAFRERPLFRPDRRPASDLPIDGAERTATADLVLLGVVRGARGERALVRSGDARPWRVEEGDTVEGWRVLGVSAGGMTLGRGETRREVLLRPAELASQGQLSAARSARRAARSGGGIDGAALIDDES